MRTQRSPVEVLTQLPAPQWDTLARAVRRAVEQLPSAQVPVGLRPFRHWHREALREAVPARNAVARALVSDARFRAEVAEAVAGADQRDRAVAGDPLALRADVGADRAVALLAVVGRWDALAALAAALAEEHMSREDGTAEPAAPATDRVDALEDRVRELERRLQQAERRETELRRRLQRIVDERDEALAAATRARDEHRALAERHDRERADHRERLARLRRRVGLAERRAAASDARRAEVVAELAALSDRLQAPLPPATRAAATADPVAATEPDPAARTEVPSRVRPAVAGRPSRLPTGVDPDSVTATVALLQVPGLRLLVDGYNVTRDPGGVPAAGLEQQRAWLVRLMGGVVARFAVRPTVIFDGRPDVEGIVPRARGVIVRFSVDETADELLVALLDQLPPDEPVLVVTSDREIRAAAAVRDANSVAAGVFLEAVAM